MPTYVSLVKITEQGIKDIKKSMQDQKEVLKMADSIGVKILGMYYVMGELDMIVIYECASDEVALTCALGASSDGNARITTLKAFTPEEFGAIVDKLP